VQVLRKSLILFKISSVPRLNSGQPLDITEESARKLLSCVDVPSQFLDLVFKFGVAPLPTDDGIVKVFLKDNRKDSIGMLPPTSTDPEIFLIF